MERYDWGDVAPGLEVTVSIGVAVGAAEDTARLLERADALLYDAKRAGRNHVMQDPPGA